MAGAPGDRLLAELQRLGRYTDIESIASGAMGRIYRAHDTQTHRPVAIKVLAPEARRRSQAVVRFREEVCAAARLRDTHVVTLFDSGEIGDTLYYVMEFVEGTTLDQYVLEQEPPLRERVALLAAIARGVEAMHRADIIHRDLKPENVLVTPGGLPVIIDLGVAKRVAATDRSIETVAGTSLGTPLYMPPEQVRYDPDRVGRPSDVYSLGVVAYQIATGRFPYASANRALGLGATRDASLEADAVGMLFGEILEDPAIPPRTFDPDFPPGLERIFLKALAKDPEDRYPDAGELARALESWLRPGEVLRRSGPRASRETRVDPPRRRPRFRLVLLAAAGLLGVALVSVAALLLTPRDGTSGPVADPAHEARARFGQALLSSPEGAWDAWKADPDRDPALDESFRRLALATRIRRERFPEDEGLEALFLRALERIQGASGRAGDRIDAIESYLRHLAERQTIEAERLLADRRHERVPPVLREILSYRPEHARAVLESERVARDLLVRFGWAIVDAAIGDRPDPRALEVAHDLYARAVREGDAFARRDDAIAHLLAGQSDLAAESLQDATGSDFLLGATRAWLALASGDADAARSHLVSRPPADRRWLDWLVAGLLAEADRDPAAAHDAYTRALQDAWYLRPFLERRRDACRP